MSRTLWKYSLFALLLVGCNPVPLTMQERGPTRSVTIGNQRLSYAFYDSATWDTFSVDGNLAHFLLLNRVLQGYVAADRGYILSSNHVSHEDVIINARVKQTGGVSGNGFGVICRADATGNGYYFLISSSGDFTISVGTQARDALFEVVPWQYHSVIRQGYQANEIRAVCAENYLAMFINDVFVAEAFDDEFTTGEAALVLGAVDRPATVDFDDVLVRDAIMQGSR